MCSYKHTLLLVVLAFIHHSSSSCTFDPADERALCPSFDALDNKADHHEWKKLNVYNGGSEPFSAVKRGMFKGYPNVKDLQVKGISNEIQPGAWEGLDSLFELHLDDNKFHTIPAEAFANLQIEWLYIYNCEVRELMPKSLNNLPKLRWVWFYGNNISNIDEGVFTDTDISHLFMRKNRIRFVQPNAFGNMDNLYHLSLEENELTSFSPQLTIGFAAKLTYLYINRNKLTKISRDMFTVMPNLQILLLNINQIERFGDNTFTDLRKLSLLDISNNRLEELQTNIFNARGMKNLQLVFLHDNRLTFLSSGTLIRLPNLKKITVGGNPWQCPCWNTLNDFLRNHNIAILCDDVYKAGKRPSCLSTEISPRDCIYDVESTRDLPKLFEELLQEYTKLPPVCNVDGVDKPALGA